MGFLDFIPVIGSAVEAGLGFLTGNAAQKQEIAAQKEMQKEAFKQQEYLLNKMNAYNTPLMQMQRYKEAGINPYVALGQISSGNQSSSGSVPSYPQRVPSGLRTLEKYNLIQQGLSIAAQQAAIKKSKASADVDDANAAYIRSKTEGQNSQNKITSFNAFLSDLQKTVFGTAYEFDGTTKTGSDLYQERLITDIIYNKYDSYNRAQKSILENLALPLDDDRKLNVYGVEVPKYFSDFTSYNTVSRDMALRRATISFGIADMITNQGLLPYREILINQTLKRGWAEIKKIYAEKGLIDAKQQYTEAQKTFLDKEYEFYLSSFYYNLSKLSNDVRSSDEKVKQMQYQTDILKEKAAHAPLQELFQTISDIEDAVPTPKTAPVTNKIRNQTNINNNNSFDGTIPY